MNNAVIWHGDLYPGNVMFDLVDHMFYPIDLSNTRARYLKAKGREKGDLNTMAIGQWKLIMKSINKKWRTRCRSYRDLPAANRYRITGAGWRQKNQRPSTDMARFAHCARLS